MTTIDREDMFLWLIPFFFSFCQGSIWSLPGEDSVVDYPPSPLDNDWRSPFDDADAEDSSFRAFDPPMELFKLPPNEPLDDEPLTRMEDISSPLDNDDEKADALEAKIRDAIVKEQQGALNDNIAKLSTCQQGCADGLNEAAELMVKSMNHVERYKKLCENYNKTSSCIMIEKKCGEEDSSFFEMFTSGLKYMCIDQALAFNATIECIDAQASMVQSECEQSCNTRNVMLNWIMRSSIAQSIQGGIMNGLGGLGGGGAAGGEGALAGILGGARNPELPVGGLPQQNPFSENLNNLRQLSNDMCRVGDCFLDCLKTKFNTRCEGSAGTLLSEVFVRPIAAGQEKMSMLSPVMGMIIPEQCSFLISGQDLAKHRIDATMDQELHRMYAEREAERLNQTAFDNQDLFAIPTVASPFDGNHDLAAMVDELYKFNTNPLSLPDDNMRDQAFDLLSNIDDPMNNMTLIDESMILTNSSEVISPIVTANRNSTRERTIGEDEAEENLLESNQSTISSHSLSDSFDSSGDVIEGSGEGSGMDDVLSSHSVFRRSVTGGKLIVQYNSSSNGILDCRILKP